MVEDFLAQVVELAQKAGLGPLYVVGLLLAAALVLVVLDKSKGWHPTVTPPEPPLSPGQPLQSGEGGVVVDGQGNPVTTDPEHSGGGATGGMG